MNDALLIRLPVFSRRDIQARQPFAAKRPGVDAECVAVVGDLAGFLRRVAAYQDLARYVRSWVAQMLPVQHHVRLLLQGVIGIRVGVDKKMRVGFVIRP